MQIRIYKSFLKRIEKSDTSSIFCYRGHTSAIYKQKLLRTTQTGG